MQKCYSWREGSNHNEIGLKGVLFCGIFLTVIKCNWRKFLQTKTSDLALQLSTEEHQNIPTLTISSRSSQRNHKLCSLTQKCEILMVFKNFQILKLLKSSRKLLSSAHPSLQTTCLLFNRTRGGSTTSLNAPFRKSKTHFWNSFFHHIETNQLICRVNQLNGFYMMKNIGR